MGRTGRAAEGSTATKVEQLEVRDLADAFVTSAPASGSACIRISHDLDTSWVTLGLAQPLAWLLLGAQRGMV